MDSNAEDLFDNALPDDAYAGKKIESYRRGFTTLMPLITCILDSKPQSREVRIC